MRSETLDNIVENLLHVMPFIHKVLLKVEPPNVCPDIHLSRLHIGILGTIRHEPDYSSTEIAKKFLIPKPQMTHLINQMVTAGLIDREPNQSDRRVNDLKLTPKGQETLKLCDESLKSNAKAKLSSLSNKELETLSSSLVKLREIAAILEKR